MKTHTLCSLFMIGSCVANGQYLHYTQFKATPLMLNAAYTGMFDGNMRANLDHRNQGAGRSIAFVSNHASVDAPVYTAKNGSYFGAGLLANSSQAGDGYLKNFNAMGSVSYHKLFGKDSTWLKSRGCDLGIGIQAGYTQASIDLSDLYFNAAYPLEISILPFFPLGYTNAISYYTINSGLSFSQSLGRRFSYTVGLNANNINSPGDAVLRKQISLVGLDLSYTTTAGCNILVGEDLTLRPAFVYLVEPGKHQNYIVGNEFSCNIGNTRRRAALFCGLWYRTQDLIMVNAGVKAGRVRMGMAYDYNVAPRSTTTTGSGIELALTYITPAKGKPRHTACDRF